jgi:hypothetical protein
LATSGELPGEFASAAVAANATARESAIVVIRRTIQDFLGLLRGARVTFEVLKMEMEKALLTNGILCRLYRRLMMGDRFGLLTSCDSRGRR